MNIKSLKLRFATPVLLFCLTLASASAVTVIDTNPTWDGNTNSGWEGSGQSLTVPVLDGVFDSFTFYADGASNGLFFDIIVSDALNGGATLFSSANFPIAAGANTVNIGQAFTPGAQIFVLFDYNGFTGQTLQFSNFDGYAGGNSSFLSGGSYQDAPGFDHRFIAQFSSGGAAVPDAGMTIWLLGLGVSALGIARKLRSQE